MKRFVFVASALAALSCSDGTGPTPRTEPQVVSVGLLPKDTTLDIQDTLKFVPEVEVRNGASKEVRFTARFGKVETNGRYTPPLYEVEDTVTATSVADPTKSAKGTVHVAIEERIAYVKMGTVPGVNPPQPIHDIYVTNPNKSGERRITFTANYWDVAWSPDRKKFLSVNVEGVTTHIFAMDANGENRVDITPSLDFAAFPDWSPDGTKIAFTYWNVKGDGKAGIAILELQTGTTTTLTAKQCGTVCEPDQGVAWSPNGTKISFSPGGSGEIYVMNADGTNPVNLSNHPGKDADPNWSPDGTKIAFSSDRDGRIGNLAASEIYTMNADGSNQTRLTFYLQGIDNEPAWSPDGSRIAFTRGSEGGSDLQVWLMKSDGSEQKRLTFQNQNRFPAWRR